MNRTSLLVDDERSVHEALGKLLRAEGCDIVPGANRRQAIGKHEAEQVDLQLLDIGLPVKDGWTALAWLSAVDPLLPVIIITGRWKPPERAAAARADVLIEKPLDAPMLLESTRELLQQPPEARARRIENRKSNLRHLPCDGRECLEQSKQGYTTTCPSGEPSVPKSPQV